MIVSTFEPDRVAADLRQDDPQRLRASAASAGAPRGCRRRSPMSTARPSAILSYASRIRSATESSPGR